MKNHITTLFLLTLLAAFLIFENTNSKTRIVRSVITPTKISIDSNSKNTNSSKIYCIDGIEAFSLEISDDIISEYTKRYALTPSESISLGYLAQDFAQKTLLNQRVKVKEGTKVSNECISATVTLNNIDYKKMLANSGFGIIDTKIQNTDKFKHNLELARKLNLVVLVISYLYQ